LCINPFYSSFVMEVSASTASAAGLDVFAVVSACRSAAAVAGPGRARRQGGSGVVVAVRQPGRKAHPRHALALSTADIAPSP